MSRSRNTWLIDWFIKKIGVNFQVFLERAYPAFLTTYYILCDFSKLLKESSCYFYISNIRIYGYVSSIISVWIFDATWVISCQNFSGFDIFDWCNFIIEQKYFQLNLSCVCVLNFHLKSLFRLLQYATFTDKSFT